MTHDKPTFPVLYDAARKTAYHFDRNAIRAVDLDSGKDIWRSRLDILPTDDLESL